MTFPVLAGRLDDHLAASENIGAAQSGNYISAIARKFGLSPCETVTITIRRRSPLDRLADAGALPHSELGELVAFSAGTAYGATASRQGNPDAVRVGGWLLEWGSVYAA